MAMYDYVRYSAPCPQCQKPLTEWKAYGGRCNFSTIEPWQAEYISATCPDCYILVEAKIEAEVEHIVRKCDVSVYSVIQLPKP